jgi:hypothetical protein
MMRLVDLLRAAVVERDFSESSEALDGLRERAACVLRPHAVEHDDLPGGMGWEPPTYEPFCGRCGYDFAAVWRRSSPWSFTPISDAVLLRYYDARLLLCCWVLDALAYVYRSFFIEPDDDGEAA